MTDATNPIKRIVVNRDLCIGAASCVINAPGVFELDAENKAVMKLANNTKTSGATERAALEDRSTTDEVIMAAAQSCPTKAILVFDGSGKQLYP